jgi:hypothetical protein
MEQPAQFEGWAIIELFGHQREIGYVTTRYFGTACMFQVDAPELPERDYVLAEPQYIGGTWTPSGAKVRKKAAAARTRLLGPGSIYALNPCTQEAATLAFEKLSGREIVVLEVPKVEEKLLAGGFGHDAGHGERVCEECGATPEEGHDIGCSFDSGGDNDYEDEQPMEPRAGEPI